MLDARDVFHTGFVVADLERGMAEFAAAFDVTWAPIARIEMNLRTPQGPIRPAMAFTYSVQGPPHLELLQEVPGTPWVVGTGPDPLPVRSAHHVGVWCDDVPGTSARLSAAGAELLVTYDTEDGSVVGFAYHRLPSGQVVEIVDASRKAQFERWFAGGSFVAAR
jgi:hypothetical protein